ncbi:fimbrial protein [Achromobacter mucicolens]|uniref:Major fimbrial subunit SMF-1 n=1 Tax=Achromobacter mucicolens TaxID=1389922 RepID=A0ABM8LEV4_9BURK|nr:fimbrial protein [Achromobacter mucicolens]CAB3875364.1 Major fimbrial subunit SMF-1 [Achromobacter mucicolens]
MKSKAIIALVIGAFASTSQLAFASDGTINFTGAISANTCTIDGNGTGSKNFNVLMPTVGVDSLTAAGQTAGTTPFTIRLTACTPGTGMVHTLFEPGANGNAATGNLTIAAGGAANVEIRLLNGDATPISVTVADEAQNSKAVSLANGEATLHYQAQYFALGQAGAGNVNATAKYTIIYQ